MSSNPGANGVTLSVEFAGVSLYVIDDRIERDKKEREVAVLMPTCLPDRVSAKHEDGDIGARHVPYLLMDLANLDLGQSVTPGLVADGPRFQVVRRLSREEIFFELAKTNERIQLNPDPLPLPDLSIYKEWIQLKPGLLDNTPPVELAVRTILRGGTLTATTLGGSSDAGGSPTQDPGRKNEKWDKEPADWTGSIKWTRPISEPLTIRIDSWDKGEETLTLRPVNRGAGDVIELKIAMLCETNPLEWKEFEHRFEKEDSDFKWLFRLFEAKNGGSLLKAIRKEKLPYPKLNPRPARTTGSTGCTGGQLGIP